MRRSNSWSGMWGRLSSELFDRLCAICVGLVEPIGEGTWRSLALEGSSATWSSLRQKYRVPLQFVSRKRRQVHSYLSLTEGPKASRLSGANGCQMWGAAKSSCRVSKAQNCSKCQQICQQK